MPRRSVASWVSLDTQGPCFSPLRLFPLPSSNVESRHCRHPAHSSCQRALSVPQQPAVTCAVHCHLQRARAARLWAPIPAIAGCRLQSANAAAQLQPPMQPPPLLLQKEPLLPSPLLLPPMPPSPQRRCCSRPSAAPLLHQHRAQGARILCNAQLSRGAGAVLERQRKGNAPHTPEGRPLFDGNMRGVVCPQAMGGLLGGTLSCVRIE